MPGGLRERNHEAARTVNLGGRGVSRAVTNTLENQPSAPGAARGPEPESAPLQDRWPSFIAENLCKFRIQASREANFSVRAQTRFGSGLVVARFTAVAGRASLARTAAEIGADGRSGYVLYAPVHGEHAIRQANRDTICSSECFNLLLPDDVIVTEQMPLGATGKIDKKALRSRFAPS